MTTRKQITRWRREDDVIEINKMISGISKELEQDHQATRYYEIGELFRSPWAKPS
jgi:hypothetical protein